MYLKCVDLRVGASMIVLQLKDRWCLNLWQSLKKCNIVDSLRRQRLEEVWLHTRGVHRFFASLCIYPYLCYALEHIAHHRIKQCEQLGMYKSFGSIEDTNGILQKRHLCVPVACRGPGLQVADPVFLVLLAPQASSQPPHDTEPVHSLLSQGLGFGI